MAEDSVGPRRPRGRLAGLDALRCLAILAVLLFHYPRSVDQVLLRVVSHYGWVGVDLFFVLSGYLIAGQSFAAILRGKSVSLKSFYYRRSIRILPNYFVILACCLVYARMRGQRVGNFWPYLVFTQNFGIPTIFGQSWSLCVEQHFYLAFPLLILLLRRRFSPSAGVIVFACALLGGVVLRYAIWSKLRPDLIADPDHAWAAFLGNIYYPTYTRLDGIATGVALAALEAFRPQMWKRLVNFGDWLLLSAAAGLGFCAWAMRVQMGLFSCVLSFTVLSLSFGLLVAAALSHRCVLGRVQLAGVQTVALWSYSIYLTHEFAFEAASQLCRYMGLSQHGLPMLAFSIVNIFALGAALFYGVERPFLKLRDHGSRTRSA